MKQVLGLWVILWMSHLEPREGSQCTWGHRVKTRDQVYETQASTFCDLTFTLQGFPGGTRGKESACQCRRLEIPWSRKWPYHSSSILAWKIPMDRGAWWATVHKVTKSQTWLRTHTHTSTLQHRAGLAFWFGQEKGNEAGAQVGARRAIWDSRGHQCWKRTQRAGQFSLTSLISWSLGIPSFYGVPALSCGTTTQKSFWCQDRFPGACRFCADCPRATCNGIPSSCSLFAGFLCRYYIQGFLVLRTYLPMQAR